MMAAVSELTPSLPVRVACAALGVAPSSWYRAQQPSPARQEHASPTPVRALGAAEQAAVHTLLNSERFQDQSPYEVYATLLDDGLYYCSISTMYRILRQHDEVQERRNQRQASAYTKPELLATGPNQLWCWDITKFKGPTTWLYYYLYVMLDVFSRYVVGWLLADHEAADLAQQLMTSSYHKQGVEPGQLTIHSDRGAPMTAKTVAQLLRDLGVIQSHSRPYTADDNPFSEAQFKTMKYRPDYPNRFDSQEDALLWARTFFTWYNNEHHHTALGLMTPATVHYGQADRLTAQRQAVLLAAYQQHPERFVNGPPKPPQLPDAVWINPPKLTQAEVQPTHPDPGKPTAAESAPGRSSFPR
jgi:putative transposase